MHANNHSFQLRVRSQIEKEIASCKKELDRRNIYQVKFAPESEGFPYVSITCQYLQVKLNVGACLVAYCSQTRIDFQTMQGILESKRQELNQLKEK